MIPRFRYISGNFNISHIRMLSTYTVHKKSFSNRHIGVNIPEMKDMLRTCNVENMEKLIEDATYIPKENQIILNNNDLPSNDEHILQRDLLRTLSKNKNVKSFIGQGYYNCILPAPIKRHILENPKWYTAYTPYQAEISQGRLESQYNYQTVVEELTGLPISNASLLDEASAAAEALQVCHTFFKGKRKTVLVCENIHPQVYDVLCTKAKLLDITLQKVDLNNEDLLEEVSHYPLGDVSCFFFQYPNTLGNIILPETLLSILKEAKIQICCSTDLLALTHLKSPKELGVDIAFGNAQRLGVPLWYGGPHPAFFAVETHLTRLIPGRIVGKSRDVEGKEVYRLGLQTREQHIRREKATSNICTAQSLLTNVVSMYSMYHGPEGLYTIANTIFQKTLFLKKNLEQLGIPVEDHVLFDTICIKYEPGDKIEKMYNMFESKNIILRKEKDCLLLSLDETTTINHIMRILYLVCEYFQLNYSDVLQYNLHKNTEYDEKYKRNIPFLEQPIFNTHQTETQLLRYIHSLQNKDYTLCEGMIPLGSCTMKLNATFELEPLSWNTVTNYHPYLPSKYVEGYRELIEKIGNQLKLLTGFDAVSFQSNSGSMGEYSGLITIKKYLESKGEFKRDICLIPNSAHGTNFASAKMANYKIVKYDDTKYTIDEFRKFVEDYKQVLGCLMITYPNTNGTFQKDIQKICDIVHSNGGFVYMDGANMNAQVGITSPAHAGADVCHLNLHKTFCIPHGGGGPGMGPILCTKELAHFLPNNRIQTPRNDEMENWSIGASDWGSASLLVIPYLYISSMGARGLREASEIAILNANYLKENLKNYYTIKDVNENGRVAHEFIIDTEEFKELEITDVDISKRLMDYSFHPPTMSWPRQNVLMFEPTESESKEELDRLIEALICIRKEIEFIKVNNIQKDNNLLKNAPHTLHMLYNWGTFFRPYSKKEAFFPVVSLHKNKLWPSVGRVDDVSGDKNILKRS